MSDLEPDSKKQSWWKLQGPTTELGSITFALWVISIILLNLAVNTCSLHEDLNDIRRSIDQLEQLNDIHRSLDQLQKPAP